MDAGTTESGAAEKQRRARQRLTAIARVLTAERGLAGFTVQELCDEVGVSRRSFFNYFSSKEDAVLGVARGVGDDHVAAFMAGRSADAEPTRSSGVDRSNGLIGDLADLAVAYFDEMGLTPSDAAAMTAALRREPSLLAAVLGSAQKEQERFTSLVVEREGLDSDRVFAEVAVKLIGALVGLSAETFLSESNRLPFDVILRSRLAAASTLLAPTPALPTRPKDLVTTP